MKKYIILSIAVLTSLFNTGCMDDYLNEPSQTDTGALDGADIYKTYDGSRAVMAGLLRLQRSQWTEFNQTDAGGLYSMLFARTVKGADIQLNNGWYNFDYTQANREPTFRRTEFTWKFPYRIIAITNQYLKGLGGATITDAQKVDLMAQARAMRGFYYFQLALEFNHAYKLNPQAAAPPVYTEINFDGKPMGTLEEVYKQVTDDLVYAVNNLGASRTDKSWVNKQVAAGMLANVYLSMENWIGAEEMAKIAYGNNLSTALHTITTYTPSGFDNATDKEWLWAMIQTSDQSNYYFAAPHDFMDYTNSPYRNGFLNSDFVNSFATNDRRKEAMRVTNSTYAVTDVRYWNTTKFKFAFTSSMPIYRTPEFVLVAAEATYRQGKITEAQTLLNTFKATRYTGFVNQNLTGTALLDEILIERRKELYGENGVEWFDAKRLQRGITRTGNHLSKVNLVPNDVRFLMKIPQSELDRNSNIPATVNNDR